MRGGKGKGKGKRKQTCLFDDGVDERIGGHY